MNNVIENPIHLLYSSVAVIALAGYLPQIYRLYRAQDSNQNVSIVTWCIWAYCWVISLIYGIVVMQDMKFITLGIINLIGHAVIIALAVKNRRSHRRAKLAVIASGDEKNNHAAARQGPHCRPSDCLQSSPARMLSAR